MKISLYRAILVKYVPSLCGRPYAKFHHRGKTFSSAIDEGAMPVR
jgi:hypothetical protein